VTRLCRCGLPALPKRDTCGAEKCVSPNIGRDSRVELDCVSCGKVFKSYRLEARTCSPTCYASYRAASKAASLPSCVVCGEPCERQSHSTCSPKCRAAIIEAHYEASRGRSTERSRKRNAHKRRAYKGKDKRELTAKLSHEQGGGCAVCGGEGEERGDGTKGLVLDHCHVTGVPRSALCSRCNAALGMVREDPRVAERLAEYARYCGLIRGTQ